MIVRMSQKQGKWKEDAPDWQKWASSLQIPHVFFASVFTISVHCYSGAWNRLRFRAKCKNQDPPKIFKLHSTIFFATKARVPSISKIHGVIYLNLKGTFHLSEQNWQNQLGHQENSAINLLSPNSDQHQFSPDNIHMLPREIVMRVNKMITKEKMLWSVNKLSQLIL